MATENQSLTDEICDVQSYIDDALTFLPPDKRPEAMRSMLEALEVFIHGPNRNGPDKAEFDTPEGGLLHPATYGHILTETVLGYPSSTCKPGPKRYGPDDLICLNGWALQRVACASVEQREAALKHYREVSK